MIFVFILGFLIIVAYCSKIALKKYGKLPAIAAIASFVVSAIVGVWAIMQSRSSTAAIGLLFLPFYCLIAALGGVFVGIAHKKSNYILKFFGGLLIFGTCFFFAKGGFESRALNSQRDAEYREQLARQSVVAEELKKLLAENIGHEVEAIDVYYSSHKAERAAVLEILKTKFVSDSVLQESSQSDDMGVVLSVIRNENVTPQMLESIYERATYKEYYYADLARNPKTPLKLLKEIARGQNTGIPDALLAHPSTTCEVVTILEGSVKNGYYSDSQKAEFSQAIAIKKNKLCN